jgi:hypothetical protein
MWWLVYTRQSSAREQPLYSLSLSLLLHHSVLTSLSVEEFCGQRDSPKLRCDEAAPSHGQRMGHDRYSSSRSGFPNLYIYTQCGGGTMTDKYGFQHCITLKLTYTYLLTELSPS